MVSVLNSFVMYSSETVYAWPPLCILILMHYFITERFFFFFLMCLASWLIREIKILFITAFKNK